MLEWLFPIRRFARLRQEPTKRRVLAEFASCCLLLGCACLLTLVLRLWGTLYRLGGGDSLISLLLLLSFAGSTCAVVVAMSYFVAALAGCIVHLKVRRWPAIRQTLRFALVGSRTWMVCGLPWFDVRMILDWIPDSAVSGDILHITEIVVTCTGLAGIVVVLIALAVQTANAVIAMESADPRCRKCGYSLLALTVPRCPECGKPFDPAKLAEWTVKPAAQQGEGEP